MRSNACWGYTHGIRHLSRWSEGNSGLNFSDRRPDFDNSWGHSCFPDDEEVSIELRVRLPEQNLFLLTRLLSQRRSCIRAIMFSPVLRILWNK